MSDAAPAATKASPKKKASKPKKPAAHPKYCDMIKAAITSLKERGGSSRQAILKYICANYKVDGDKAKNHLKIALRAGIKNGTLKQSKGTGASGSFRLGEAKKAAKKPKAKKAKKPKAAAAKKPKAKKAKKPKAKKPAGEKKAAKPKKTKTPKKAKPAKTKSPKKPKAAKKAKKTPKKAAKK